jgi:chorismate-pyruvate lyase
MIDETPAKPEGLQVIAELCSALGLAAPAVELLAPEQLPPTFRILLVHSTGMTSALERHWREMVRLELLSDDISLEDRSLYRFVVLRTKSSAKSVEIAFIRIPLEAFAPAMRLQFIEAKQPFGTLLAGAGIKFHARPQAYFMCKADPTLAATCGLRQGTRLYGRVNKLLRDDGVLLCETVEALTQA